MIFTGMNHMAFITRDIEKTIRFYRDLLQMELFAGIGHEGFRHYFFKCGDGAIAFFEYDIAKPMEYDKFHGSPTDKPIGFDHVSLTVPSREALFALKDKLEAADIEVTGAVDHGTMWSIYFFDPNGHRLELVANTHTQEQVDELRRVAPAMLEEWSRTKKAPRHAAWLHELEFRGED